MKQCKEKNQLLIQNGLAYQVGRSSVLPPGTLKFSMDYLLKSEQKFCTCYDVKIYLTAFTTSTTKAKLHFSQISGRQVISYLLSVARSGQTQKNV
jgi:hypothetical protein